MTTKDKMICPDCGVEMNYHAEKIDYAQALAQPEKMDPALGGVVQEVHSCPGCGKTTLRESS